MGDLPTCHCDCFFLVIAYMDAPCFASHMTRVGEVGEIATVHSDFVSLLTLSLMGIGGRDS